jgi:PAS domain S-box-containing protein
MCSPESFFTDEKNEIIALLGVTREITERKRAEEKISTFSADLQRLLSVSREMTATTDIARLYRAAVQTAVDLLRFDFSTIMVLSDDRSTLMITDSIGFPASMIGHFHLVEGQGLATYALKNMTPEFVVDFQTETRFDVPAIVRDLHIRSALCVPMMLEDRVFGVLIGHTLGQREFSREDIAIYQSIGNQAAIAITNAMNVRALRDNQERLDLALQSAHMGVWRWELKENRRYFDDLTCQLMGIVAATFTGTEEVLSGGASRGPREDQGALARTIEQKVLYEPAYRVVWPDGSVRYITARGRLVRDDKGQPVRINGIVWDITDQRRLEQELIETEKLESISTWRAALPMLSTIFCKGFSVSSPWPNSPLIRRRSRSPCSRRQKRPCTSR